MLCPYELTWYLLMCFSLLSAVIFLFIKTEVQSSSASLESTPLLRESVSTLQLLFYRSESTYPFQNKKKNY